MPSTSTVIGLVQFTRGLNLTRQRFKGRRTTGGSVGRTIEQNPEETSDWQIFPYAAGLLQAYAARHAESRDQLSFLPIVHAPVGVDAAVDSLAGADIVAFSAYVWNIERSLAAARAIKAQRPSTLVVFGGPQVPDHAETFLRSYPFIDVACHGEGERTFAAVVDRAAGRLAGDIAGTSWLDGDRFEYRPPAPRMKALDEVPSPYLEGVFDPIMAADPTRKWVLLWETNRGCPFACTFCDWGSAVASKVYQFDRARLSAELEWFASKEGEFIFCCDANFGILPRDVELAHEAAAIKRRVGYPRTLSVQNTKNATERSYQVQKTLADAGMNAGVTLSLQSTDAHTLKSVKRDNISLASFEELQRRYTIDRIPTYTDIILGLPGETYESFANGVSTIVERGQHTRMHFYHCSLLPNAEMSQPAYREEFGIKTVRQAMIDMHGPIDPPDGDVTEFLEVAVTTSDMPAADWVRTRVFAWAVDLFLYDRLLYLVLVVMYSRFGVSIRKQVEAIAAADPARFPVVGAMFAAFNNHALDIQRGGNEYIASSEWLGIFWPADQHALITLATTFKTDEFYDEVEEILAPFIKAGATDDRSVLHDAIELNRHMLRLPFELSDSTLELQHDILGYVHAAAAGRAGALEPALTTYRIKRTRPVWVAWEQWYEHVIFCQNQKATYLYPVDMVSTQTPAEVA